MLEKLHPVNVLIYSFSNGNVFEGFYDKGVQKGTGSIKYADGTRRDGEWKGGKLHGFAFFHFNGPDSPRIERWDNGINLSVVESEDEVPIPSKMSFSSPGDHRRAQSVKSFRFPPEILDQGSGRGEHAFQVSKDDFSRRKQLFESIHAKL